MDDSASGQQGLDPNTRAFYCRTLEVLNDSRLPFLIGGAYALAHYTGIERHTKDFDIFVHPNDVERILNVLSAANCQTALTFPHWLGKACCGDDFIDVIFSSGNGVARVDEAWFTHAINGTVLDIPVKLCPSEEMIWSKSYVMERERFDGADIAHLLRACGARLDWSRLLVRFGAHWRVLFSHLMLFGFIYPSEHNPIPSWVMDNLLRNLRDELGRTPPKSPLCQGTLLSRTQYLIDLEYWGYKDARLEPIGNMTAQQIAQWTEEGKKS